MRIHIHPVFPAEKTDQDASHSIFFRFSAFFDFQAISFKRGELCALWREIKIGIADSLDLDLNDCQMKTFGNVVQKSRFYRKKCGLSFAFQALLFASAASAASTSAAAPVPIQIAITIDDLPSHGATLPAESRSRIAERILAALKKHKVGEAYGFVNAKKAKDDPSSLAVLRSWKKAGYPLGNHAYSHMNLTKSTSADFIADIQANETPLSELERPSSYKWFRYPFLREGDTLEKRNAVRAALAERGYRIAQVTIDFEDWAWNDVYVRCVRARDTQAIQWLESSFLKHALVRLRHAEESARSLYGRSIRHILLIHVGIFDSQMMDRLLSEYEKAGARFISLEDAATDPIYTADPGLTATSGETFLSQVAMSKGVLLPAVERLPLKQLKTLCQ